MLSIALEIGWADQWCKYWSLRQERSEQEDYTCTTGLAITSCPGSWKWTTPVWITFVGVIALGGLGPGLFSCYVQEIFMLVWIAHVCSKHHVAPLVIPEIKDRPLHHYLIVVILLRSRRWPFTSRARVLHRLRNLVKYPWLYPLSTCSLRSVACWNSMLLAISTTKHK